MLSRLASRLKLLTGGASDLPARQQTLRAAIEWSHDLLDAGNRVLFRRLSVFVGGSTLEAAEAVCAGAPDPAFRREEVQAAGPEVVKRGGVTLQMLPTPTPKPDIPPEIDVLDGIQSLIDSSLLKQQEVGDGVARVAMLETIREYAQERLAESGEMGSLQRKHALFFLDMAEQAEPELRGPRQIEWLGRLDSEHDNFRAALRWAEESGEAETGLRLVGALGRFWFAHGHLSEGRNYLESALIYAHGQGSHLRARALYLAGRLAMIQGDYETARSRYEQGLALFNELGDKQGSASVLNDLGNVLSLQGDYAGRQTLQEESLALFREIGDRSGIASALLQLGGVRLVQGDYATARSYVEESLQMLRQLGDLRGIAMSLFFLANADLDEGLYASACARYDEGLKLFRELGDKWTAAALLVNMGKAVSEQGDYVSAEAIFEESRETFQNLGARRGLAESLAGLASVAHRQGDDDRACDLFLRSLKIRSDLGDKLGMIESLEGLARVTLSLGLPAKAVTLFGVASAHRRAMTSPLPPGDHAEYERNIEEARALMGEEDWRAAWAKGEGLPLREAVNLALHDSL
jgi:tetratricopeptide (TPR) repeat protein